MKNKIYEKYFCCVVRCGTRCGTRSLSRRVPCPLLKVVLEAKKSSPQKKVYYYLSFLYVFLFFLFFLIVLYVFYSKSECDQYFPFWATSMHFVACS